MRLHHRTEHRKHWQIATLVVTFGLLLTWGLAARAEEQNPGAGYKAMQGRETFRSFCSSCHGREADGTGRVAEYLTIPPADLTRIAERHDGEFPHDRIHAIIDGREKVRGHGTRDMPVWGDVFQTQLASDMPSDETADERADRKIEELIAYLRSIQLEDGTDPTPPDTE